MAPEHRAVTSRASSWSPRQLWGATHVALRSTKCYGWRMTTVIGQRDLRNDNAEIMRRVEAGERFTVTRHGVPIADLVPHDVANVGSHPSLGEIQREFRSMRPIDRHAWRIERQADDDIFGPDDPTPDETARARRRRGEPR